MKTMILTITILFLCVSGYTQSKANEKAVQAVLQKMEDAWNAHDYTYSGQFDIYAPDATMINPVGMYWKNRAEIIKAHQVFGETMFKYTSSQNQQVDIRFLAPAVALATVNPENSMNFPPDGPTFIKILITSELSLVSS